MSYRRVRHVAALLVASVAAVSGAAAAGGGPMRLQVRVDSPLLQAGASVQVAVVFLDDHFRPVPNDRHRTVRIDLLSTGDGTAGRADILPAQIKVPAGAASSTARLVARSSGSLLLRATSDGLAPGEAVVRIRGSAAALSDWLMVPVHAQEPSPARQLQPA